MTSNAEKPTTRFNVHWGDVMLNVVRRLPVEDVKRGSNVGNDFLYLGRPDIATGDPTEILLTSDDRQIVCFAGTSEVGISDRGANSFDRVAVGQRPVAMAMNKEETQLFVLNQLDDSISVIDLNDPKELTKISIAEERALTELQLGEQLFYDSTLSSDGWFSCHSCHTEGHSNGALVDTFGDGFNGDAKRVPTLLGVGDTGPWAWNGKQSKLLTQVHKSVTTTMRGKPLSESQAGALEAYIRSLAQVPSVAAARGQLDAERFNRGKKLFSSLGCADCHSPGSYTSADNYEVEFEDESGNRTFNPPSLRAVSQRGRLLHDNRAESVRDVIERLGHQNDGNLSNHELDDLIYFVEGL